MMPDMRARYSTTLHSDALLPPVNVFAADDAPDSITLLKADYNTGASSGGLETYTAPGERSGVRFWRTPLLSFNWWRLAGSNR